MVRVVRESQTSLLVRPQINTNPPNRGILNSVYSIYGTGSNNMLKELQLDDSAPWKKRFRAPVILWTALARTAPDRGLAASNKTGARPSEYEEAQDKTEVLHRRLLF